MGRLGLPGRPVRTALARVRRRPRQVLLAAAWLAVAVACAAVWARFWGSGYVRVDWRHDKRSRLPWVAWLPRHDLAAELAPYGGVPPICAAWLNGTADRPLRLWYRSADLGWNDVNPQMLPGDCDPARPCEWVVGNAPDSAAADAADAVVWFPFSGSRPRRLRRGQVLAVWNREPREFSDWAWSEPAIDVFLTYNLDANVPITYPPPGFVDRAYAHPIPTEADFAARRAAVWVSSNCAEATYNRSRVVELLRQYVDIDCLGTCLNTGDPPPLPRTTPMDTVIPQYKLWLGLEKSIDQEYVTEKFLWPLMHNAVGVYIGTSRAAAYAPAPDAYVDALAFPNVAALGRHLQLLVSNYSAWVAHFDWRRRPPPARLRELDRLGEGGSPGCRLCACLCNATCLAARGGGHGSAPNLYSSSMVGDAYLH